MLHAPPSSAVLGAADPTATAHADPARDLIGRQLAALSELAEIGMEIARAAGARATASLADAAAGPDPRDPTLAYGRAARAVRMCFALQTRLMDALSALDRAEEQVHRDLRQARRKQIVRLVEQVSETEHRDEIEEISCEAWERLRDADEYGPMMTLPLREAVALICADLYVTPDWSLWDGEGEANPDPDPAPSGSDGAKRRPEDPVAPPDPSWVSTDAGGCAGSLELRSCRPSLKDDGEPAAMDASAARKPAGAGSG